MSQEKYRPNSDELEKAEETMTDEQKLQSESREEGFELGRTHALGPTRAEDQRKREKQKEEDQKFKELAETITNEEIIALGEGEFLDFTKRLKNGLGFVPSTKSMGTDFQFIREEPISMAECVACARIRSNGELVTYRRDRIIAP